MDVLSRHEQSRHLDGNSIDTHDRVDHGTPSLFEAAPAVAVAHARAGSRKARAVAATGRSRARPVPCRSTERQRQRARGATLNQQISRKHRMSCYFVQKETAHEP